MFHIAFKAISVTGVIIKCNRNRAVGFSSDNSDCNEKIFKKIRPRIINYRCFSNEVFRDTLTNNLSDEEFGHNDKGLQQFCKVLI